MEFGGPEKCHRFTALGTVVDDAVYQVQMRKDFEPYRVGVTFEDCGEVVACPLLRELSFVENEELWGTYFRRGFFEIPNRDCRLTQRRMDCGTAPTPSQLDPVSAGLGSVPST